MERKSTGFPALPGEIRRLDAIAFGIYRRLSP